MDLALRNKLWSALHTSVFSRSDLTGDGIDAGLMAKRLWIHFFRQPVDTTPTYEYGAFAKQVREWFFKAEWYEVYDFIEELLEEITGRPRGALIDLANSFLELELSAYRIVEGRIAEITNEEEIKSIEEAMAATTALSGVHTHLNEALAKLTSRSEPDYRNSIKESISAVEAMCRAITGEWSATLGQAIKRLREAGVTLHPSLEQAWLKLYGYTSDKGGIRHALTEESEIGFADAKYMYVSCTAFINHLVDLVRLAHISLNPPGAKGADSWGFVAPPNRLVT